MADITSAATRRNEVGAVYAAGLVQGLALVTFPAAASILTNATDYGLSSAQYGAMFLPQAVTAVAASLAGGRLSAQIGLKRVLLLGLGANVIAMALLLTSQIGMGSPLGYGLLLLATASLGVGFGLTVPSLNTYAAVFYPARVDRATLYLNALLGLGTALAPVIAAVFLGIGLWWGLSAVVALALLVILVFALRLPLATSAQVTETSDEPARAHRGMSSRAWLYVGFALLYGIVETINGNWATVYVESDVGASASAATLALAAFWGMVTVGRLVFAAIERRLPSTSTYRLLPFVAAAALLLVALVPQGNVAMAILGFGLAGLGCSALLPLTISFGEQELLALGAATAGILFASYQVGYGIAAFGVGPLEDAGIGLGMLYAVAAGLALVLAVLSARLVKGQRTAVT
jgi:fucose permease